MHVDTISLRVYVGGFVCMRSAQVRIDRGPNQKNT
jgi:hypothetical protein